MSTLKVKWRQDGAVALSIIFLFVAFLSIILAVALPMSGSNLMDNILINRGNYALFLAESGLERTTKLLSVGTVCDDRIKEGAMTFGKGEFEIEKVVLTDQGCQLTISGSIGEEKRTVTATVARQGVLVKDLFRQVSLAKWDHAGPTYTSCSMSGLVYQYNEGVTDLDTSLSADSEGGALIFALPLNGKSGAHRTSAGVDTGFIKTSAKSVYAGAGTLSKRHTGYIGAVLPEVIGENQWVSLGLQFLKVTSPGTRNSLLAVDLISSDSSVYRVWCNEELTTGQKWTEENTKWQVPKGKEIVEIRIAYDLHVSGSGAMQVSRYERTEQCSPIEGNYQKVGFNCSANSKDYMAIDNLHLESYAVKNLDSWQESERQQ